MGKSIQKNKSTLGFGTKGVGVIVWDRSRYEHGDYKSVAHIRPNREVKFYSEVSDEHRKEILEYAEKAEL
jgi:hypothetical protein